MKVRVGGWAWVRKEAFTEVQLRALKANLTVIPRKVGNHPGETPDPIYLYREDSDGFVGVPREYYLSNRKPHHEVEFDLTEGRMDLWGGPVKFAGTLRDEQQLALKTVASRFRTGTYGGILRASPGWGKCLGLGTLVLRFDGSTVPVEAVKEGDLLMGPDSKPRRVLSCTRGVGPLYRIVPTVGAPWVCNDAHILTLVHSVTNEVQDFPLQDYLRLPASKKRHLKQFSPEEGVEFQSAPLPLDPYFVGVWFGAGGERIFGSTPRVAITTKDAEIEQLCRDTAAAFGLHVRVDVPRHPCPTYVLAANQGQRNRLLDLLREVVGDAQRLPKLYLCASRADRLKLLAGLLDTDGFHNNGCYEIVQKRKAWAEDICFLARSLGFRATLREKYVKFAHRDGEGTYWRVKLVGDFTSVPLRIARKLPRGRRKRLVTRTGFSVESLGEGEYAGFTLDGDGRFLLGDFVVTHNTVWSAALTAEMQVPTLVVVHKEFLMNQWRERIAQFLPGAQVGYVQEDTCDFKGKHIVLAMVHSLAGRDYGPVFSDWPGLVIFDECHRVGAATWSQVPPKFRAKWRLGITATPRRKDGADNVFYHHIGRILFTASEQRMKPKIRRVWTDFKLVKTPTLNPALLPKSLLLRFMCAHKGRNKTIVKQLVLALNAGRKVLVLSERLAHLTALDHELRNQWKEESSPLPSIGYYVGGMSEAALEVASQARVIFATRQFAEEGLDIPALDTLLLTTPMSDVEQATGRILRPFPGKKDPIVVDFRDDNIAYCVKMGEARDRFYARIAS